jgi:hypothetical protein
MGAGQVPGCLATAPSLGPYLTPGQQRTCRSDHRLRSALSSGNLMLVASVGLENYVAEVGFKLQNGQMFL